MSPPPWRPSPTQIGTRTALEMPSKPTSSSRNRESSSRKSPSPPTEPRSELAAAAKSTSSASKPPRAAKVGSLESTERGTSAGAARCPRGAARTTGQAHSYASTANPIPFSPPASSAGCLPWALLSVGSGRGQGASGDPAFLPSSKPHILDRLLFLPRLVDLGVDVRVLLSSSGAPACAEREISTVPCMQGK